MILRVDDQRLKGLVRMFFRNMSNQRIDQIASLDNGPGRTNRDIAQLVGLERIKQALDDFYTNFPEFGC